MRAVTGLRWRGGRSLTHMASSPGPPSSVMKGPFWPAAISIPRSPARARTAPTASSGPKGRRCQVRPSGDTHRVGRDGTEAIPGTGHRGPPPDCPIRPGGQVAAAPGDDRGHRGAAEHLGIVGDTLPGPAVGGDPDGWRCCRPRPPRQSRRPRRRCSPCFRRSPRRRRTPAGSWGTRSHSRPSTEVHTAPQDPVSVPSLPTPTRPAGPLGQDARARRRRSSIDPLPGEPVARRPHHRGEGIRLGDDAERQDLVAMYQESGRCRSAPRTERCRGALAASRGRRRRSTGRRATRRCSAPRCRTRCRP